MDITVFGAGIAGLMTGIALRAQGHRCHIYERMRKDQDTGMGFILLPEGEHANVISLTPPLTIPETQLRKTVRALARVLRGLTR